MNSKKLFEIDSKKSTVYDCSILYLPKIENRAGNITPLENMKSVPFEIKRIYYLYDVPGGESRGGHAHKQLHQLIVAASGSFDVLIDDGHNKKVITLSRPYLGLHIIPGIWRELINFSSGSICLVLASEYYDENDYIRNYSDFIIYKKKGSK
ncbi:WxcM-like domain-containing protein [Caldithrix abyssi DSM 13497]|uniref:WxcM-like domain-containing protein n=1 Tax=Caldithrix abyssi DSM 13497 TaxID=880073 RepID=H1XS60_CALAY|nr:FdtA/QdtA family cupin domain-containing protein [Caldithrix abyssi]EHO40224.1 WxcM-like domain-containing protein [Caldithrix abyssi DSM 13497]